MGARPPRPSPTVGSSPVDVVILVPAHDEEGGIVQTLKRLSAQLDPNMRILLVADNCSDATAALARSLRVETVERADPARLGKGYALAWGRDHLALSPPEVVIVLDADCATDAASLRRLVASAMAFQGPIQALNLLEPARDAPSMVQVGAFAFAIKNQVRQLGTRRLGGPALLNGTGMAFPWRHFVQAPLASGHLAEDLELGIALARAGRFSRLDASARVSSPVSSAAGTLSQRERWERGFLSNGLRNGLPTIGLACSRRSWKLLLLGAHLLVPPLALLAFLAVVSLASSLLLHLAGASAAPFLTVTAALFLLSTALTAAWLGCGRAYMSGGTLLRLPLYLVWKIPIYASMLVRKPARWVRTERS